MERPAQLLGAGAFREVALLSTKALRLYAESGLLRPAYVDPVNGYRYYEPSQAQTGRLISMLRAADVPLEEVAAILSAPPAAAVERVVVTRARLRERSSSAASLLGRVADRLSPDHTADFEGDVTVDWVGSSIALTAWAVVGVDDLDDLGASSLARLQGVAEQAGVAVVGDPFAVFHGTVTADTSGPIEVFLPVAELPATAGSDRAVRTQAGWFASTRVSGATTRYPAVLSAYDRVATWSENSRRVLAGPPREIWVGLPWSADPQLVVSWPVGDSCSAKEQGR